MLMSMFPKKHQTLTQSEKQCRQQSTGSSHNILKSLMCKTSRYLFRRYTFQVYSLCTLCLSLCAALTPAACITVVQCCIHEGTQA